MQISCTVTIFLLYSTIHLHVPCKSEILNCGCTAQFVSDLVGNPKHRFSCDADEITQYDCIYIECMSEERHCQYQWKLSQIASKQEPNKTHKHMSTSNSWHIYILLLLSFSKSSQYELIKIICLYHGCFSECSQVLREVLLKH